MGGSEGEAEIKQWRRLGEGKRRLRRGRVEAKQIIGETEARTRLGRGGTEANPMRGRGVAISRPRPSSMRRRVVAEARTR